MRMVGRLLIYLLFFCLSNCQVKILSPSSLVGALSDGGKIKASTATFGAPSYGESFIGAIYYVPSPSNHCEEDYISVISQLIENSSIKSLRTIFLVHRGGCSFVKKTEIAKTFVKADAVIVVNDDDTSSEAVEKIIMADDGHGAKLTIPSLLISKHDGLLLEEHVRLDGGEPVLAELEWNIPKGSKVTLDFWSDSGNQVGQKFLREFKPIADSFHTAMEFNAHFNIFGQDTEGTENSNLCHEKSARFCAEPPDSSGTTPITGREVLMEDLRQLCLRRSEDETGDQLHAVWWSYVEQYPKVCPLDGADELARFGQSCSEKLLRSIALTHLASIDDCMKHHYQEILQTEKQNKAWSLLALRINGARYSGALEPILVARAACVALDITIPACKEYMKPGATIEPASAGSLFFGFMIFIGGLVTLGFGICIYQAHVKKSLRDSLRHEVMLEVRAQMQDYQAMEDEAPAPRRAMGISGVFDKRL